MSNIKLKLPLILIVLNTDPMLSLLPLHLTLPSRPNDPLTINTQLLQVLDPSKLPDSPLGLENLAPHVSIATILHAFHPSALLAFLDVETWFSTTWICNLPVEPPNEGSQSTEPQAADSAAAFEISRIRNQITLGRLDATGCWTTCLTWDIAPDSTKTPPRYPPGSPPGSPPESPPGSPSASPGSWIPNLPASTHASAPLPSPSQHTQQATRLLSAMLLQRAWTMRKSRRHEFYIEVDGPADAHDPGADGIAMYAGWLYAGVDVGVCARCAGTAGLGRCARCGTAGYCSQGCQQGDWAAHRVVCGVGPEERGRMLALAGAEGMVGWKGKGVQGGGESEAGAGRRISSSQGSGRGSEDGDGD